MIDFEIKILGSVSPFCYKNKNCVGIMIYHNNQKILLDCGNGVTRNMVIPNDLENLNIIISHLHKDHYGDLSSINYAAYVFHNYGLLKNKIKVYTPSINSVQDCINYSNYYEIKNGEICIGDLKVTFHDNNSHGIEAYMVKIESEDNVIVYTSDIGNTNLEDVVKYCSGANLLICESSLLITDNSKLNTHLHAYEAGLIAKRAKVSNLLLTHFWPLTDKNNYLAEAKQYFYNTDVAVENKRLILRR